LQAQSKECSPGHPTGNSGVTGSRVISKKEAPFFDGALM